MTIPAPGVLILGAGINGCALARELLLNGVSVWLVDESDIASGATSGSSRLIHGGLRYLEYGEFDLVKESLAERGRLLRLAPQFVRPLRLWIPVSNRLGALWGGIGRYFGWRWWPAGPPADGRGVWLIRAGLNLYDQFASDALLPPHQVAAVPASGAPPVDAAHYRWLCSYYDAQVPFAERLVLSLLADARQIARQFGLDFRVWTHHQARLVGRTAEIRPSDDTAASAVCTLEPAAIVNATGAWVDETLKRLQVPSQRLMAGTKGTHLFSSQPRLRNLLGDDGIYAEAADGRPIFVTPLADTVLVGTTDEIFSGPPEKARATRRELDYLLSAVNAILPDARLTDADIDFHYAAVRPLPYVGTATPAAVTRRHFLEKHDRAPMPMFSVVGGKLTTMRSLAESAAASVLAAIRREVLINSQTRILPGGENYPPDRAALDARQHTLAQRAGLSTQAVVAAWRLLGTQSEGVLTDEAFSDRCAQPGSSNAPTSQRPAAEILPGLDLPTAVARWSIRNEWAARLPDLVERRLMLLYDQRLSRAALMRLAELLVEAEQLSQSSIAAVVDDEVARLQSHYGKRIF